MRRRLRRKNFFPQAESLEPRLVLNAQVGVDLAANATYFNDPIWTDLHNLAYQWEAPTTTVGTTSPDTAIPLTATDYPLANAATSFDLDNYPNGSYEFSYAGTATVTFSDIGQLAGPVTVSNGVTSGTVIVNHATGDGMILDMQVTGLNAASPMGNFHLMMPGYGNGSTPEPMFTPAFLQQLKPFSDIRFMGWEAINNSTLSTWANRVTPSDFITDGSGGVPFEDMIELCNEAQTDMWINIPVLATPQFVQSLAQLISANLDPNLNVYVEYGNENWNYGYNQIAQVYAAAKTNPLVTQSAGEEQMVAQQSAYEEVSDAQIFEQVFGSASAQVRPIMAGWTTGSYYQQYELQFIQQTYGPPSQFIYATAVAPYIGLPSGDNVAGLTVNQLFADLNQALATTVVSWLQSDDAVAKQYGLPLVSYEGGQGLAPGANDLNYSVMQQALADPRMYQFYISMMNDWQQAGGTLFNDNTLAEPGGQSGFWGMLPNVLAPGSQSYDALISLIEPAGDANFDGIVDYPDFQTVEANYGATNAYWEQGDFNDDGVVNWQDLNILKQNLDPAGFTLSQFAQAALFGQPSTIVSGQPQEYDGYGVTYASSVPISASSGTVKLNENGQGAAMVLGGETYSEGLGVLANSSITLNLNGQYTQFESTIGVDGYANTGSSVIFEVYGNGQLLYQSPTLKYANGGVPIDVNVTGITQLTLEVLPGAGSNSSIDYADWASARVISTANFGATTPYTLSWQVTNSQGTVVSTFVGDSYNFAQLADNIYTLTLTVTNGQGNTATQSEQISVGPHTPYWIYAYPGNDQVELDWASVASSYDIYRSTSSNPSTMVLYETGITVPKFVDTNVTNGTTYYYEIVPVDANGYAGPGGFTKPVMPANLVSANTFVGNMTFVSTSGTVVRNRSALPDSFDSSMMPLVVWGVPYTSGLGVQGNSTVQVALNGGYSTLSTVIGLDAQDASGGAVIFTVVADGKTLYTSPTVTLSMGMLNVSVNVAGYNLLSLITTVVSGSGTAVAADWCNAQLAPPASTVLLSSVPITVGGNAIKVNTNFQGTPLMLGGIEYAQGIGVATDTKMVISTDGAYSTLTATIGVDSLVGVGGNVWFQILGDGKNLYFVQSITATSAPIPISINITGVQSLTLVTDYMGATNSSADDADWALAELHVAPPATPTVLVSAAPITVSGNPIKVNTNVQGTALTLGGNTYSQGIGVAADTTMVINTNGAYSTFTATIGVDSLVGVGGTVWFQVLGDGKNLYFVQSITATSAPISLSINITGVKSLSLVTDWSGSANSSKDDADWALAQLHT